MTKNMSHTIFLFPVPSLYGFPTPTQVVAPILSWVLTPATLTWCSIPTLTYGPCWFLYFSTHPSGLPPAESLPGATPGDTKPTWPAVPATTIWAVYLQSATFCIPSRGSSL